MTDLLRAIRAEMASAGAPVALWAGWESWLLARAHQARVDPRTEQAIARRQGSVAVVPVMGAILPRPSVWEAFGIATSVATIRQGVLTAAGHPDVKAIVLDIDSPGGVVSGVPELAAELRALRGRKPIVAQADYLAASAAYWLASAADEIVASPSAQVGSVGVYAMHVDYSGALEREGIAVTFIAAPSEKVEGNPYQPLASAAREHMQKRIEKVLAAFRADVAESRGTSRSAIPDSWARVYDAAEALKIGMVDKVRPLAETLAAYGVQASGGMEARRRAMALAAL